MMVDLYHNPFAAIPIKPDIKDPDTAARAYLRVIGHNPAAVTEALRSKP